MMRLSDPFSVKLVTSAHVETLRGRRLPRRPPSPRGN